MRAVKQRDRLERCPTREREDPRKGVRHPEGAERSVADVESYLVRAERRYDTLS